MQKGGEEREGGGGVVDGCVASCGTNAGIVYAVLRGGGASVSVVSWETQQEESGAQMNAGSPRHRERRGVIKETRGATLHHNTRQLFAVRLGWVVQPRRLTRNHECGVAAKALPSTGHRGGERGPAAMEWDGLHWGCGRGGDAPGSPARVALRDCRGDTAASVPTSAASDRVTPGNAQVLALQSRVRLPVASTSKSPVGFRLHWGGGVQPLPHKMQESVCQQWYLGWLPVLLSMFHAETSRIGCL